MASPILIKLGIAAIKNPKAAGKLIKVVAMIPLSFLLIVSAVGSSVLSFFSGDKMQEVEEDVTNSKSYKSLMEIYDDYMDNTLTPEMDAEQQELYYNKNKDRFIKKPDHWDNVADLENIPDGESIPDGSTSLIEAHPEIKVHVTRNDINPAYLMAYFTHATDDFKAGKTKVDESVVRMFLSNITKVTSRKVSDTEYMIYNAVATPEEAAAIFFGDPAVQELYLISFDLYTEYIGIDNISFYGLYGSYDDLEISLSESGMKIPVYYQNDYRSRYGTGTIASSGCGPTSIAMVMSYLTKETITPEDVVAYTGNKYYVSGSGSSWGIFPACASHWHKGCENLGKSLSKVLEELAAGHPVIASMGPGVFTSSGHIIVIRGTKDGYFLINDPNRNNVNKYRTDQFIISKVYSEAKNFWSFY